jgi:hypothetical protein
MAEEKFNAVLEGCDHDSPSRIQYCPIEIFIPANASVLRTASRTRLVLRGKFPDFEYFPARILKESQSPGWSLRDESQPNPDWIGWTFEMARSITTRDGRFYMNEIFYRPQWEYYSKLIPTILQDCAEFFAGRKSADELVNLSRRAF